MQTMPTNPSPTAAKSPGATQKAPGAARFQTAWRGTHTARRHTPKDSLTCKFRLAEPSPPPGATLTQSPLFVCCRVVVQSPPPGATPVLAQY